MKQDDDFELDRERVYGNKDATMDDLSEEEIHWLEENDPERLGEIGENTNELYLDMMFPDGMDED